MPNYPTKFTFTTKNGQPVRARLLRSDDAPYLVDLFENMSLQSRYQRFMQTAEHLEMERIWSEAEQIAQGVAVNSCGLIAFCDTAERPDIPVAAARYVRLGSGQAEIAVSVRDDMQNKGIGTQLLELLIELARGEGIERLVGIVQNDNMAVWNILKKMGFRLTHQPDGTVTAVTLHIDEPRDFWDAAAEFSPEPQIVW